MWNKESLSLLFIEYFLGARTFPYVILNDRSYSKADVISVSVAEAQRGKSLARGQREKVKEP